MSSEDIITPEQAIIDAHHHLWDYPGRRYLLDEFVEDISGGHRIVATVFMECGSMYRASGPSAHQPVGETEFVHGVAAMSASGQYGDTRVCERIVGFADLALGGDVGAVLDEHLQRSDRFVGVRHASGWDNDEAIRNSHTQPSQHLLGEARFRQGFAELARRNLSFDAWLYHPQIPQLTALAEAFPEQTIIFDHFGGPLGIGPYAGRREEIFTQWRNDVTALSHCDNVVAKLGGLVMPINGFGFHKQDTPPDSATIAAATERYYHTMIELFGPSRCMFESNFPVDKVSCSYTVLWNAFKRIAEVYSKDERQALFHDTAARIYRIETASAVQ